jgi:hypothetical protein
MCRNHLRWIVKTQINVYGLTIYCFKVWPDEEASARPLREIGQKAEAEEIRLEFDDYSFDLIDDRKKDLFEKGGRTQGQVLRTVIPDFDLTGTGAMLKDLIAPPNIEKHIW